MEAGNNLIKALRYFNFDTDIKTKLIGNGANSNVYIVGENQYILKFYRTDNNQPSRLDREFYALKLFAENKIENVPKIIGKSNELNCSLMTHIDGTSINVFQSEITDEFANFYKKLLNISFKYKKNTFESIDACPSIKTLLSQVNHRILNLEKEEDLKLKVILDIIKSHLSYIKSKIFENYYNNLKSEFSVVDFGINNVILNQKNLYFIDFEFFGLDNPVHLISDTIAHPANNLNIDEQLNLYNKFLNCHDNQEEIINAFIGNNLIFDLKWCLIMLNPFLSNYVLNVDEKERELKKKLQLEKVINKITLIEQKMKNEKFLR
jgi:predicted Ser/Thr protein kinase